MISVLTTISKPQHIYRFSLRKCSSVNVTMPVRDTTPMLTTLRRCLADRKLVSAPLAAYIVPSCDAHNSEYLADVDARREALSGFTGSAGTAIVTPKEVRERL